MAKITANTQDDLEDFEEAEESEEYEQLDNVLEDIEDEAQELENMSEVEIRLEEANYFKALLQNPLFSDTDSPIAARVEKRVRGFIQSELRTLLGLEVPKAHVQVKSDFNENETKVLKALANKVLNKEKIEQKSEPTVNVATVQPTVAKPTVAPRSAIKPAALKPAVVQTTKKTKTKVKKEESKADTGKKVKTVVNTPEGPKEVEINVTQQTKPQNPIGFPTLNFSQMHEVYSQQALTDSSGNGIISAALGAIDPSLNGQLVIDKGDE
jgi:hypothetical protein